MSFCLEVRGRSEEVNTVKCEVPRKMPNERSTGAAPSIRPKSNEFMAKILPDQLIDTHLRVESCKKESHDVLTIEIRSGEVRADVPLDVQSDVKRI